MKRVLPIIAGLAVLSCDSTPVDPTSGSSDPALSVSASVANQRAEVTENVFRIAHGLATALGRDVSLRERVRVELANSPFREGKVELARVIRDEAVGLGTAVAEARGIGLQAVLAAADSIPSMALYFPVDAHRSWGGGDDLLVAALLDDDGETVAYDLAGNDYPVAMEVLPERPTLVLAPAEVDFERSPSEPSFSIHQSGGSGSGDVLTMTKSYQPDDHEPEALGDPEIYVHLAARDSGSTGDFTWTRCSGDAMGLGYSNYQFDQNNSTWTGAVQLATRADADEKEVQFWVWEDDSGRCDGVNDLQPKADTVNWSIGTYEALVLLLTATELYACHVGAGPGTREACLIYLYLFKGLLGLTPHVINDDPIGYATAKPCFDNISGPERFRLEDENGNYTGAYIEIDDGYADRELCPPTVSIGGDDYACTEGDPIGELSASTTPNSGGLTYKWTEDGVFRGTGSNMLYTTVVKVRVGWRSKSLERMMD